MKSTYMPEPSICIHTFPLQPVALYGLTPLLWWDVPGACGPNPRWGWSTGVSWGLVTVVAPATVPVSNSAEKVSVHTSQNADRRRGIVAVLPLGDVCLRILRPIT